MTRTAKILLIDDVPANLISLKKILRGVDAELYTADNGFDALTLTLEHDFALVLTDVQMPEMDGFEVCEQLRASPETENIPVIFLSAALRDEEHRLMGYVSGATDYVTKPIHKQILLAKVQIFLQLYHQQQQLIEMNERLQQLVQIDPLTRVYNRRAFFDLGDKELQRYKRYEQHFSVALLDIDHFKSVNDTYGHITGDETLLSFASCIRSHLRDSDIFARIGGEEFAVILPHTDDKNAVLALEKLLAKIRQLDITSVEHNANFNVTFSAGVSSVRSTDNSLQQVMSRADKLLYQAKHQGRNQVLSSMCVEC